MIINISNKIDSKTLRKINISDLRPYAEGWYGIVYKLHICGKGFALKQFKSTMHEDVQKKSAFYDYEILKSIGNLDYFPTLHAYKEREWFVMDFIDGELFRKVEEKESYRNQLHAAYQASVEKGWYPDDVKGDNLIVSKGKIIILDVGSFLPAKSGVKFDIADRVDFVIKNAHKYPSVRQESPYQLKGQMNE